MKTQFSITKKLILRVTDTLILYFLRIWFFFSGASTVKKIAFFKGFSWFCYFIFKANQDAIPIFVHSIFRNFKKSFFVSCLNFGRFDRKKTLKNHENSCTIFGGFWDLIVIRDSRMADPPFFLPYVQNPHSWDENLAAGKKNDQKNVN